MTCTGESQGAFCGIEDSENHGDEACGRKVVDEQSIEALEHFTGRAAGFCEGAQNAPGGGHQESGCGTFSGYVSEDQPPAAFFHWDEVEPVAADGSGGNAEAGDGKTGDEGRTLGKESLLDGACFEGFAGHLLALFPHLLEDACVLYRDGDVAAESLQG